MNLPLRLAIALMLGMACTSIVPAAERVRDLDKVFAGIARCRVDHIFWTQYRSGGGRQAALVNALFDPPSEVTLHEAGGAAEVRNVGTFLGLRVTGVLVPMLAPRDDHMQWYIEFDEPFERVNRRLAARLIVPYPVEAIAPDAYKDGKRPWLKVNITNGKPLLVCDKTAKGL